MLHSIRCFFQKAMPICTFPLSHVPHSPPSLSLWVQFIRSKLLLQHDGDTVLGLCFPCFNLCVNQSNQGCTVNVHTTKHQAHATQKCYGWNYHSSTWVLQLCTACVCFLPKPPCLCACLCGNIWKATLLGTRILSCYGMPIPVCRWYTSLYNCRTVTV